MDETSGQGMGDRSSLAAAHRAWRSPEEQPRLTYSAGSRDLFPLERDPQRDLPPKGYSRCVETLRRHLVDDALSALNWLSGKRSHFQFHASRCKTFAWRGRTPSLVRCWGVCGHRRCANFLLERPFPRSYGSRHLSQWCGIFHTSLPQNIDAVASSRCHGACSLLSVLPDSAGRYLMEPERMITDSMLCAQVLPRRRTYLELIRLLARRWMVRFTLEPKERVGLFAVRKDGGWKQKLIVDARRSDLRFRPCPNVELFSSESFSKLEVDPANSLVRHHRHQRLFPKHVDS